MSPRGVMIPEGFKTERFGVSNEGLAGDVMFMMAIAQGNASATANVR
jgi:hypothetical protein